MTALSARQRRLRTLGRRSARILAVALIVGGLVLADQLGAFGRAAQGDWDRYHDRQFKVARIVDGDTLDVDCPDAKGGFRTTRVRLLGVDTPESVKPDTPVQHYGREAADYLREAAMGKTVTLRLDRSRTRGRYKRLLGYVISPDGKNINQQIVATGHGYADPRFRHPLRRQFKRAQAEAKETRRGLWRDVTEADLPYYYRDKMKLP